MEEESEEAFEDTGCSRRVKMGEKDTTPDNNSDGGDGEGDTLEGPKLDEGNRDGEAGEDVESARDFLNILMSPEPDPEPEDNEMQAQSHVCPQEKPLGPESSWDFSLQSFHKKFVNTKWMWIEGPVYQNLRGDCRHEMRILQCPCEEKKDRIVCRLCHQVFCSMQCFKKAQELNSVPKTPSMTIEPELENSEHEPMVAGHQEDVTPARKKEEEKEAVKELKKEKPVPVPPIEMNPDQNKSNYRFQPQQQQRPSRPRTVFNSKVPDIPLQFQRPVLRQTQSSSNSNSSGSSSLTAIPRATPSPGSLQRSNSMPSRPGSGIRQYPGMSMTRSRSRSPSSKYSNAPVVKIFRNPELARTQSSESLNQRSLNDENPTAVQSYQQRRPLNQNHQVRTQRNTLKTTTTPRAFGAESQNCKEKGQDGAYQKPADNIKAQENTAKISKEETSLPKCSGTSSEAIDAIFNKIKCTPPDLSSGPSFTLTKKGCPPPDIPAGVILPVFYVSGDSLNDFSVMTPKSIKLFKKLHQRLQIRPKERTNKMERGEGDGCLVKYKYENYEWYRGVITKVASSNSNSIDVYLVDVGKIVNVNKEAIYKLPKEKDIRIRPLAIRMCVHNLKFELEEEMLEAKEQFQSIIRDKPFKVQITHEVSGNKEMLMYAGKLIFKYINKWCDVTDYLQKMLIGRKRSEQEIKEDIKLIPLKPCSTEVPIYPSLSGSGSRCEHLGVMITVINLDEFYFATKEMIQMKIQIEERLNTTEMIVKLKDNIPKSLNDLSQGFFAIHLEEEAKIVRVTVLEVAEGDDEPLSVIVFALDSGVKKKVSMKDLMILPEELRSPSTVYKCSLPVKSGGPMQEEVTALLRKNTWQRVHVVLLRGSQANDTDHTNLVEVFFMEDKDSGFTSHLLKQGFQLLKNVELTRPKLT